MEGMNNLDYGQVAQLVEQRTENPRVGGSIPPLATILHFRGARPEWPTDFRRRHAGFDPKP